MHFITLLQLNLAPPPSPRYGHPFTCAGRLSLLCLCRHGLLFVSGLVPLQGWHCDTDVHIDTDTDVCVDVGINIETDTWRCGY